MIKFNTKEQQVVVELRMSKGYEFIGYFPNIGGIIGDDIGIVKGKHRMHINSLGYDGYIGSINE